MYRPMRQSIFILSALIIGLLCSLPAAVGARATITVVTGYADLLGDVLEGGEVHTDSVGNVHFHHFPQQGIFALRGGNIAIDGQQTVVLNGLLDASFSGPFAGTYTVSTGLEEDTVLWEGHVYGQVVLGLFTGRVIAHGRGPFAGMLLLLNIQEDATRPETFALTGRIRAPRGQ